jgi:hypothetical protein
MARIHGRVVGRDLGPGALKLKVEDQARSYDPKVEPDGAFEMNLPPGSYSILATSGNEVAIAQVDNLAENEDREVTLVLTEGAAISGRIEGCDGPCVDASIRAEMLGGRLVTASSGSDEHGEFAIDGLAPGRSYDLVFAVAGKRRLVVHDVTAPREGLLATLEPAATLNGGFGLEAGQKCPMESVEIRAKGVDQPAFNARFDHACRFRVEDLPEAESVHLRASGKGWHFELDVPVPAHGDPPFLCLRPTCRAPEPESEASLEVIYSGASPREMYVQVELPELEGLAATSCDSDAGPCVLRQLRALAGAKIAITAAGCEPKSFTVDLRPGANSVNFTCEAMRRIQGLLRAAPERIAALRAQVRCSSDRPPRPVRGFVFMLQCPEYHSTIEYQVTPEGPWRAVAVRRDNGSEMGFAEILAE